MEIKGNYFLINNQLKDAFDFDEGFLNRGKNLYEVVRVIKSTPLFLEDHFERFLSSANRCNLKINISVQELSENLERLIGSLRLEEGNIKFIYHFENPDELPFFIAYRIAHFYPHPRWYKTGVHVSLLEETRPDPNVKNWRPEFREKVKKVKAAKNIYEVLLMNNEGIITEGSQSNVFYIKDERLFTAREKNVLPGITRKYILEMCRNHNIPAEESDFGKEELASADAVFITGTSPMVLPVSKIDEIMLKTDNKLLRHIMKMYNHLISSYINARK